MLHSQAGTCDPGVRLVAAVKAKDPVTKSANLIARYMMQIMSIPNRWIIRPQQMRLAAAAGVSTFIFIDDFLGTGDQFAKLVRNEQIASLLSSTYVVYAPLVAHIKGVQHLTSIFRNLKVCTVELLDERHELFHGTSITFADQVNTTEAARFFYYDLLERKGIAITGSARHGYGELELAYSFEHATPNNCLPILWWREGAWQPLFENRIC
jgi:hypothetical protein